MRTENVTRIEDLPLFSELEGLEWGMDFHATYDELFARPYQGLMRLSTGEVVAYTNADVGALRATPGVTHHDLDANMLAYPPEIDMSGFRDFFAPTSFVRTGVPHTGSKHILSHVMSPRGMARLREGLSGAIREVLVEAAAKGDIEFKQEVAHVITHRFWEQVLGLTPEETEEMLRITADMTYAFRYKYTAEQLSGANQAAKEYVSLLQTAMKRNAQTGKYPFLTDMLHSFAVMGPDGRPDDPYAMVSQALMDGFGTLAGMLTIIVYTLMQAGVQPADYAETPSFAANAFMETMRLNSPVAMIGRVTDRDIEYQGLHIPAGTSILLLWLVSMYDPQIFPDPNSFSLERGNRSKQYLFGGGPYICGGRNLVRLVAETFLAELASLKVRFESRGEATLFHDRSGRDVMALPLRMTIG